MSLRWDCIKNGCYKDNCIPDWGFLEEIFIRGIRPTDIDGTVEINGYFLFLEWKNKTGKLSTAQSWYFERLTKLSDKITVYIFYGDSLLKPPIIEKIQIIKNGNIGKINPGDLKTGIVMCTKWNNYVNNQKGSA